MSRNNSKSSGLRFLWIPGRRSHFKGRFSATNKRIDYSRSQKKNEQWSLGGTKGQRNLLEAEGLESSPSISGLVPVSCAAAAPSIASTTEMPALTENKFNVLAKIDDSYQLPSPPKEGEKHNGNNNHVSASDLISDSTSNHNLKKIDEDLEDDLPSPPNCEDHHSDVASEHSPHKKHSNNVNKRRSYNNYHPEVDINSIESVSETKLQYSDLDITDGVYCNSHNKNKKRKNKKNKHSKNNGANEEEEEKIVKCLYYTLMCCECTIS